MANNYMESSSYLELTKEQLDQANAIIDRCEAELDEEDGYCGVDSEIENRESGCGIWFHGEENVNVEHMEYIARALIEELEIDKPFFASWSYTCSKPRIDEFGGGAFAIVRGKETIWVDAMQYVQLETKKLKSN